MNKIDPTTKCPACTKTIDALTFTGSEKITPKPGHFSICWYCGCPLVICEGLKLRKMTDTEFSRLSESNLRIIKLIQSVIKKNKLIKLINGQRPS